jgi:hypothetical protein
MMHVKLHIGPDYAERAYFEGDHCQHVVAWQEERRLRRIIDQQLVFLMEAHRNRTVRSYRLAGK